MTYHDVFAVEVQVLDERVHRVKELHSFGDVDGETQRLVVVDDDARLTMQHVVERPERHQLTDDD